MFQLILLSARPHKENSELHTDTLMCTLLHFVIAQDLFCKLNIFTVKLWYNILLNAKRLG